MRLSGRTVKTKIIIFKTYKRKIFLGGMIKLPLAAASVVLYTSFEPHHFHICSDAPVGIYGYNSSV